MSSTSELTAWLEQPAQQKILAKNGVHFGGVHAADRLPDADALFAEAKEHGATVARMIMNYSNAKSPDGGTHWCGMAVGVEDEKPYAHYFDSYGTGPDADDAILSKVEHHPFHTHFHQWLEEWAPNAITFNHIRMQASGSLVCGNYSAYYVLHGMPRPGRAWNPVLKLTSFEARDKAIARLVQL